MMDQKREEEKERRKRRNQRLITAFFVGLFFMNILLMMILPPFSKEAEIKGKVIFYVPNRGSALVFLSNKIFPVFEDNFTIFDKNVNVGDFIQKAAESDSLIIYRNNIKTVIKLEPE
ncbi:hypothetical protein [Belliella pelovolcani]|uniref:Uncharacterized protein n=1 Tax=Belliella pelovolcani TaxID=529505 RepID=A0A1N7JKU7_9BACT|nr:hypothetical protein [Belliella pelovolcani]SIS49992.1 hypothetical protein SAMN05421761_101110 [Belliella pelovolcani]